MRGYQEGDDLRRIHWPSVARTGDLMIRQDESSKRASGLVFIDTRAQALGQSHGQAFERAVSVGATLGVMMSRRGFSLRLGTAEAPAAAVTEDRFLDALAGISHAQARSIGPALSHLRAAASAETTLVFVSSPPAPGELTSLIRSGAGLRSEAGRPDLPRRALVAAARAPGPTGRPSDPGRPRAHPSGVGRDRPAPVHEAEGTMARTQGTSARTQRLITVVAMCLLALTSALAIGRVFVGTASTYEMVVVALASALLACAMERRNLLLATAVSALGMLIAIGLFVFPETTWFGLPTLETISAAVRRRGADRRTGEDPGGAHRAAAAPAPGRPHRHVGRHLLRPCAGLPGRQPAAGPVAAGRARGLRRHGARRCRAARVRRRVPGRRHRGGVRRQPAPGPGLGAGVGLSGPRGAAHVHGRQRGSKGGRRHGGRRDGLAPADPGVRVQGDLGLQQPERGPGADRSPRLGAVPARSRRADRGLRGGHPGARLLAHGGAANVRRHELEAGGGAGGDRRGARHAAGRRTPSRTRRSSATPRRSRSRSAPRATWRCRGSPCPTSRSRPTCSPTTSDGTRRAVRCC